MAIQINIEITESELRQLAATDPQAWFTQVRFANADGPRHPHYPRMSANFEFKYAFVHDWLERVVPGARVLDTFCANGAFAFESARLGAARIIGVEFDPARVECGRLVAAILRRAGAPVVPDFIVGDTYDLPQLVSETFDVTLLLGGLYHVEDPVRLLRKIRQVTGKYLVLQTSWVLPLPGNLAWFFKWPRPGRGPEASDIPPGGRWRLTPGAIETMLRITGFRVIDRRRPPLNKFLRFPWYGILAAATD